MGRRRDDEEEPSSDDEDEEQSSEDSEAGSEGDSDASASDEDEDESEVEEDDVEASKRAAVERDAELMRNMVAEIDKIKMRLQFRLATAREAKAEAMQRECEQREERERRQAMAADFDAPALLLTLPRDSTPSISPPPVPVTPLMTDAAVQTANAPTHVEQASQVSIPVQEGQRASAHESLYSKGRASRVALSSRARTEESNRATDEPPAVEPRSPGLSIYDLNESVGMETTPHTSVTASAFCDKVMMSGMSRSTKMDPIPSESSNSEFSATPDDPSYHSAAVRHSQAADTGGSDSPQHQSGSVYSDPTIYAESQPSIAEPSRHSTFRNSHTTGTPFNGLDSLRPPLSPLAASSMDGGDKTDEQRELEAIHVLLFDR